MTDIADGVVLAAGGNDFWDLLAPFQGAYGADVLGSTIMRIRMIFSVQGTEPLERVNLTHGAGVFPETLAVAEMDPFNNIHLDWMFWESTIASTARDSATTVGMISNEHVDIRSKRKLDELQDGLFLAAHNNSPSDVIYHWTTSVLIALP